jgi:hypothetical protein
MGGQALISVGRRHGVPDRLERFQATLDPGVKTSSRLHHAHCGAMRSHRGEPPLRWILPARDDVDAAFGWTSDCRRSADRLPRKSSTRCCVRTSLQQRQVGSRPAIAQGFRESTAYPAGTHRASVNGSAASFRRSLQVGVPRTCKVHAMIASRSRLGVRAPSHHKTSYQRRLGRIAHKHLHMIGSLARRRVPLRLRPIPMQQPSRRGE